jgi:hypothetical protein
MSPLEEGLYASEAFGSSTWRFTMTTHQQVDRAAALDLLEEARMRGHLVLCLPGVSTIVLSPGGHGDGHLISDLARHADMIDRITRDSMPTAEQAAAWSQLKRDQRALDEP